DLSSDEGKEGGDSSPEEKSGKSSAEQGSEFLAKDSSAANEEIEASDASPQSRAELVQP
ncbi:hypothetical protein HAX54_006248, partial [Datura stramonium]|nr:hypothetical protein [Datura stramonium]